MNEMSFLLHLTVKPPPIITRPSLLIRIHSVAVTASLGPLPIVGVPVRVCVDSQSATQIVDPTPLVLRSVWIQEHAVAVFLALYVVSRVSRAIFESTKMQKFICNLSRSSIRKC